MPSPFPALLRNEMTKAIGRKLPYFGIFAVGFGCALMKCGVVGGERTSKLNELLRVEASIGGKMASPGW